MKKTLNHSFEQKHLHKFFTNVSLTGLMAALILISSLTGCNPCHPPKVKLPCCINGRRPPVIHSAADWVIDYDMFPKCEPDNRYEKRALTPEDFNPFFQPDTEYLLSIGDVLQIEIYGDDEMAVENVPVAPDGRIYYGFTDGIPAAGRSVKEVSEEIEDKIKHLFVKPIVTVIPKTAVGHSFKILGRVQQPGLYPIEGIIRLRDAIGLAGGLYSEYSEDRSSLGDNSPNMDVVDLDASFIVRNGEKLNIDFRRLLYSADNSQNVFIRSGDYIYLAPSYKRQIFVLGAVRGPIALPFSRNLTLMSALAQAGGWQTFSPYGADTRRVLVIRGCLDCPYVAEVDVCKIVNGEARDLFLQPGDIVYAQHKSLGFGRELVRIAIDTFVQSFASVAAGYYSEKYWFRIGDDDTTTSTSGTSTSTTGTGTTTGN